MEPTEQEDEMQQRFDGDRSDPFQVSAWIEQFKDVEPYLDAINAGYPAETVLESFEFDRRDA